MLLTFVAQAQTFEWFKTPAVSFDANATLIGYPNTVDASNNIYVTGYQDNRFLYGEVFGHMLLHKYNTAGDLLFSKTIEGHVQVYNIKTDTQGHVLLLAGYVNQIKIGNWELNTEAQGIQPILLKFDHLGNFLWHLPLNTIDPFINHAEALAVNQITNDYYVAFDNFDDAYIQKISSDGNVVNTIAQTDTNRITSLSIDSEQNIYAAGSCASANATYAGVVAATNLPYNTYVVKYNPNGVFQWVKYVEDITCTTPMVVAHTPDEVYFFANDGDRWTWMCFGKSQVSGLLGSGNWYGATCSWKRDYSSAYSEPQAVEDPSISENPMFFGDIAGSGSTINTNQGYNVSLDHGLDGNGWSKAGHDTTAGTDSDASWASTPASLLTIVPVYNLMQAQPNLWNGEAILIRIQSFVCRGSGKFSLVNNLEHCRFIRNTNYNNGDTITLGADVWHVYPMVRKNSATPTPGGTPPNLHSGTWGIAVRE